MAGFKGAGLAGMILGVCVDSFGYFLICWLYIALDLNHLQKLKPVLLAVFCNSAIFLVARYCERKFEAAVSFPRQSPTRILLIPFIVLALIASFRLVYCGEDDLYCPFFRNHSTGKTLKA